MTEQPSETTFTERHIAALKRGEIETFNLLYELYGRRLLAYVSKATRTREDAADIVHDIFISVWHNRENLDTQSDIGELLFSLAYRRRIDYFRHLSTVPVFADFTASHDNDNLTDSSSGHQTLEYHEFLADIERALNTLPKRQREIVRLSRMDGLTNSEIAARLGITEKTVRNEISLGLKLLKKELNKIQNNN